MPYDQLEFEIYTISGWLSPRSIHATIKRQYPFAGYFLVDSKTRKLDGEVIYPGDMSARQEVISGEYSQRSLRFGDGFRNFELGLVEEIRYKYSMTQGGLFFCGIYGYDEGYVECQINKIEQPDILNVEIKSRLRTVAHRNPRPIPQIST